MRAGRGVPALLLAVVLVACGGGDEVGVLSTGSFEAAPPAAETAVGPGDAAVSSTTVPPVAAPTTAATSAAGGPERTTTLAAPATARPPVPLPDDPAAVVLRVSRAGGYPMPGASQRVQPIELQAGGRLVRPAPYPPPDPSASYHRLDAFEVSVEEVRSLVAAAEDGGAISPPADLGSNPTLADWGVQVFEVDRPGLRSRLVVRDLEPRSTDAPNLTPDQRTRRRGLLSLMARLETVGRPTGPFQGDVRAVATPVPSSGPTTSAPAQDLRTWPGPPLEAGQGGRCVVQSITDLDRRVPGWSSATVATRWQSGSQVLQISFYDATTPGDGCAPA